MLAGGKGNRIRGAYPNIPKTLIPIAGKPILQRQIEILKKEGVESFLLVVGYLSDQIIDYFGDGSRFGVKISYFVEEKAMGTGGALLEVALPERFLLCNGDLVFDFSLEKMLSFHLKKDALITLFAHASSHPFDSTVMVCDKQDRVTSFSRFEDDAHFSNLTNAGVCIVEKRALTGVENKQELSFDEDVVKPLLISGRVFAYKSTEYVKDAGTPQRLAEVCADVSAGIPEQCRADSARKAVFLDRDGTVNVHRGYVSNPEELELLLGAAEAINAFHALGYLVILVTNQPVVARGLCTIEDLEQIHRHLVYLLAKKGAYLDDIFYCPHHPDSGFKGENKAYKIDCDCRKPKPGLILKAAKKYNIDLSQSFMVGDSERDMQTALNAGCRPILLSTVKQGGVPCFESLKDFAAFLTGGKDD